MTTNIADWNAVAQEDEARFPIIAEHLRSLRSDFRLNGTSAKSYALSGDGIRALWTREAPALVRIHFTSRAAEVDFLTRVPLRHAALEIANGNGISTAQIVQRGAFTIDQVAWHDGQFIVGHSFFEHVAEQLLVLRNIEPATAYITLLRTFRLVAMGFRVSAEHLDMILNALNLSGAPSQPLDLYSLAGGTVLPTR
jgi:hypothetical protein